MKQHIRLITENPDKIILSVGELRWTDHDAWAFFWVGEEGTDGKILMAKESGIAHDEIYIRATLKEKPTYPGRAWTDRNVLTFWIYPSKGDIIHNVIPKLDHIFGGIDKNEWEIELPYTEKEGELELKDMDYGTWRRRRTDGPAPDSKLITLAEFEQRDEGAGKLKWKHRVEHVKSPMDPSKKRLTTYHKKLKYAKEGQPEAETRFRLPQVYGESLKVPTFARFIAEDYSDITPFTKEGGNSLVNADGSPIVYIHFSDNMFTEFKDQSDPEYQRKHSLTNRGIYFHTSEPTVKYGKNKYEVYLRMENPFVIDTGRYESDVTNPYTGNKIHIEHINNEDIRYLNELGHDGVIAKYPSFQNVVFDADQTMIVRINDEPIV